MGQSTPLPLIMRLKLKECTAGLLLCGALGGAFGWAAGCRQPAPPSPGVATAAAAESTSLQAPFVLRLKELPATGTTLNLMAILEAPASSTHPVPVTIEVLTPAGLTLLGGAPQQPVRVGGTVRQVSLPLSFLVAGPRREPITVRASLRMGNALGAAAERHYPESPAAPPPDPLADPAGDRRRIGGVPIAAPIATSPE